MCQLYYKHDRRPIIDPITTDLKKAGDNCYATLNKQGDKFGNCGKIGNLFVPCSDG